ncbi:MAG: uroporphyrinogen-III decarboxylase-like protein [Armatimonadetes bacterium]|nr:uroporphyrinogen-III decarboxylase-like protein [Armatimonadota bacterium]
MTPRERALAALKHEQPDQTPFNLGFTVPARQKLAAHFGGEEPLQRPGNCLAITGARVPGEAWVEVRPDHWRDEFGVVWNRTIDKDIGNVEVFQLAERTLAGYSFPDPRSPRRFAHFPDFIRTHGDQLIGCDIGFSLFERAWTLRGMENLFFDMMEAPAFVDELLDAIADYNVAIVEEACRYPIDFVMFGDDWGQQRGLLMGPKNWRRFIKPRLERTYAAVKRAGRYVFIHSCGDVDELFPELIAIGLDCFNPFQPEVMDVRAMKREYGRDLAFYGGVSTQRTLPYGTPDDVRREVWGLCRDIGKEGGYICAPAHSVPRDVPLENLLALIEAVQQAP